LARRLARKHRTTDNNPPAQADGDTTTAKIRTAAAQLRQTAHGDAATVAICNEVERLIDSGWTVRKGGGETTAEKRWPLLPEWGGKEPPEGEQGG
jgi:hypothetical protein